MTDGDFHLFLVQSHLTVSRHSSLGSRFHSRTQRPQFLFTVILLAHWSQQPNTSNSFSLQSYLHLTPSRWVLEITIWKQNPTPATPVHSNLSYTLIVKEHSSLESRTDNITQHQQSYLQFIASTQFFGVVIWEQNPTPEIRAHYNLSCT
jgi:hypothetical protein